MIGIICWSRKANVCVTSSWLYQTQQLEAIYGYGDSQSQAHRTIVLFISRTTAFKLLFYERRPGSYYAHYFIKNDFHIC